MGWSPGDVPSSRVFVQFVEPGAWAAKHGLEVGDELVELNGKSIAATSAGAFDEEILQSRPLSLLFACERIPFVVYADESVGHMGWSPSGFPPEKVLISFVEPDSWAAKRGLKVNDELVAVNGDGISIEKGLCFDHKMMELRPLSLSFVRVGGDLSSREVSY